MKTVLFNGIFGLIVVFGLFFNSCPNGNGNSDDMDKYFICK
jgi:hypothetical protein